MAKKKNNKKSRQSATKRNSFRGVKLLKILPSEAKNWILGILMFILSAIFILSFFNLSGIAGENLKEITFQLIGKTIFAVPLIFVLGGIVFFVTKYKNFLGPIIFGILILIWGICGFLQGFKSPSKDLTEYGGWVGYVLAYLPMTYLGFWVNQIIFASLVVFGGLIFWYLLKKGVLQPISREKEEKEETKKEKTKKLSVTQPSLIKKIFFPKFKVKEIESTVSDVGQRNINQSVETKIKETESKEPHFPYQNPPVDLLDSSKEVPTSGDLRINSAIIKKTLQNFDILVEMSEINIGPTVTQYTLKPTEGVKLSKITGLSNDLALALAAHPIRIEAPIPGRSLVGIEIPNKVRAKVRLKDLIANPIYQQSPALTVVLGRDVSGSASYADLARMPHLLVAGSTGAGKTIFLNNLILSLIYRNSSEILNFILIDPKRVEFPIYNELPHLLAPVICDSHRAVNALRWLIGEMERRFEVLAAAKARDVKSYNSRVSDKSETLPYIVLVVDELADLMAARGRDMEAGIVRLAQMSRAVGIHLIVATQRPSVEVITGLIKANITTRVSFQVASQVDSRTVLDTAGAEKLLGFGDLLFLSTELGKPRRMQGSYISDKEVKRVVNYIVSKNQKTEFKLNEETLNNQMRENLERTLDMPQEEFNGSYGDDPLFEEAHRVVTEARKASASLLQRRLRIGYARAARLIDMLEEKGIVGPGEGAKPREVFSDNENEDIEPA
ncbi:DNA translocase FtsK [Patescibacteria group bacterium]